MEHFEIKNALELYTNHLQHGTSKIVRQFNQGCFDSFIKPIYEADKKAFIQSYLDVIKNEINSKITENVDYKYFHFIDILPFSKFIRSQGYIFAIFDVIKEESLIIKETTDTPYPEILLKEYARRYTVVKSVLNNFGVPMYSEENALKHFLIRKLYIDESLSKTICKQLFINLSASKEISIIIRNIYQYELKSKTEVIDRLHNGLKESIKSNLFSFVLENCDTKTQSEIKDGLALFLNYIYKLRDFITDIKQKELTETYYTELKNIIFENKFKLSSLIINSIFGMNHAIRKQSNNKKHKTEYLNKGEWLSPNITFLEELAEISALFENEVFFNTLLKAVYIKCSIQFSKKMVSELYQSYTFLFNNILAPKLEPKLNSMHGENLHKARFNFNNYSNLENHLKTIKSNLNITKKKQIVKYLYCDNRQPKGIVLENGLEFGKTSGKTFFKGLYIEKTKEIKYVKNDNDEIDIKRKLYKNSIFSNYKIQLKSNENICLILNEIQLITFIIIGKNKSIKLNKLKESVNMPYVLLKRSFSSLIELKIIILSKGNYTLNSFNKEKDKLVINAYSYDYEHYFTFFNSLITNNNAVLYNLINYMSKIISREGFITVEKSMNRLGKHFKSKEDKEVVIKDALDKFKEYFIEENGSFKFDIN